jgi:hypothetical protein
MADRPRITVDEAKLRELFDAERIFLPNIGDEKPAGELSTLIDSLIGEHEAIKVPEGYRLSVLNDDEIDICGLIVEVEAVGNSWPLVTDGWSDIDNYLPVLDDQPAVDDADGQFDALSNAIHGVIGRADRCMAFIAMVRGALELVGDVALGNSEYDTLSEIAERLLQGSFGTG